MEDDGNNEPIEPQANNTSESDAKQIAKLNEYVQQMAYTPIEPPQASERTEALARAPKKYILGTYAEHKDNFKPKERSERVARIVQNHTPMTIENFEQFIRNYRKKQIQQEKNKKRQQIKYHETVEKLQKQCEDQLLNAIVAKFSKMVSKRACSSAKATSANVETESYQRLQHALFCNMIFDLQVPNYQQSRDLAIYQKLAACLADLILQALFLARNAKGKNYCFLNEEEEKFPASSSTEKDEVIKIRALRAAKKKSNQNRLKCGAGGCAPLSHRSFK